VFFGHTQHAASEQTQIPSFLFSR